VLLWDDYRSKSGNVLRGRRGKLGQEGLLVLNVVKHVDARVFEGCLTTFKKILHVFVETRDKHSGAIIISGGFLFRLSD